ncbi:MAG TPA: efflux RND transporter periplasmic adaptor subunit [Chthoniobacterales bacterium]
MASRSQSSQQPEAASRRGHWPIWVIAAVLLIGLVVVTIQRVDHARATREATAALAIPTVHVITPKLADKSTDLILPGNVEPFQDTPVSARTSGYVTRWLVDIGADVKQGQLLAEIDSPELDQQLRQAQADAVQAAAALKLAQVTAARWKLMLQHQTVSQQDADEKQNQVDVDQANLTAAEANVQRLQELRGFEQVVAPFGGRIAARNVNVGDLITAGSTSAANQMFRIVQDDILRVFVHVPEVNAGAVHVGQEARIEMASAPGQAVTGKVVHLAGEIDPASRTLLVEIQVDNSAHRLLAGGYATVHLALANPHPALIVPANVILFRPEGTVVGVVGANGKVNLQPVQIGRDYGTEIEIAKGLQATDQVIVAPSDSLENGDIVKVVK